MSEELEQTKVELEALRKTKELLERKCKELEEALRIQTESIGKIEEEAMMKVGQAKKRISEIEEEYGSKEVLMSL